MLKILFPLAMTVVIAGGAFAAETPAGAPTQNLLERNQAINTEPGPSTAAPAKGANSFTEAQARSRIEEEGYTNVTALKLDQDGIWRGTAMHRGQSLAVALDFKGDVFPHMAGPTTRTQ
jgi:hypothetical protein